MDLSLRESRVSPAADKREGNGRVYPEICSFNDIAEDMVLKGYVSSSSTEKGVFVWLNRCISGRILVSELSDSYVKNVPEQYPVGSLVWSIMCARYACCVIHRCEYQYLA